MKSEVVNGKTPNDGVETEIYYLNDKEELVGKYEATKVVVRELDQNGNLINETMCFIGG